MQTDNSYFAEKVKLRVDNLPDKEPVNVLDMFAGQGLIWNEVEKRSGRKISVLGIDKKAGIPRIYLLGDNEKYLINYSAFDLIDVDAYGIPYRQVERIINTATKKLGIFATAIQSMNGALPHGLLVNLGFTKTMLRRSPAMFNRHGQEKFLSYLAAKGIKKVKIYCTSNKRKTIFILKFLIKFK